jgi:hypothetical protein
VVRALGEPPVSTGQLERWEPKPTARCGRSNSGFFEKPILAGGEHELSCPAHGLTFVIDRVDRQLADPPIHRARVQRTDALPAEPTPAASTTLGLHGLRLGQAQQHAMEIAKQHLVLAGEAAQDASTVAAVTRRSATPRSPGVPTTSR